MHIGLDFGTTNTKAAVFDGRSVRHFQLDPGNPDPTVIRSIIYVTRDHQVLIGRQATEAYYQQNIGRPSKFVRKHIGDIEMVLSDVGSVKGYPVEMTTVVRDVYAMVDELTPGRLLHSLKSSLASGPGSTSIFGRTIQLEHLIAVYLREIRQRVETAAGNAVQGVTMGTPVSFVDSPGDDGNRLAVERLRRAALEAGYPQVEFELEPVAAARHYQLTASRPLNILVFDLGGGTLDLTVMQLGTAHEQRLLATGGLDVAGDTFNRRLIQGLLLEHLGRGSTWSDQAIPFPEHLTESLLHWQSVLELNRPETLHFLELAEKTSNRPKQIRALASVVVNNYVARIFDEVDRAKIGLSTGLFETIRLVGTDLDIWQPITRSQFESLIAGDVERIGKCVRETLCRSGLAANQIDAVVRTGGSGQVPRVTQLLGQEFGPKKVVDDSVFGSVAAGLAIGAWQQVGSTD